MSERQFVVVMSMVAAAASGDAAHASYISSLGVPSNVPALTMGRWDGQYSDGRAVYGTWGELQFERAVSMESGERAAPFANGRYLDDILFEVHIRQPVRGVASGVRMQFTWTPDAANPSLYATALEWTDPIAIDTGSPSGPVLLRVSPALGSTGQATITPIGGGRWQVDSFFDVWTEISIDGGGTWIPSDRPISFTAIPAPGVAAALGIGGWFASRRRRGE